MYRILLAIVLLLVPATLRAETNAAKQIRLIKMVQTTKMADHLVNPFLAFVQNVRYYDTAVELLAATPTEGTLGYAIDTNAFYLRAGAAWVALGNGSGILGTNGGTFGNETNNVWTLAENSENLTLTFASDLVTLASGTAATFAFTPAVGFTGDVTLSGGAGALTFGAALSSVVVPDHSATGLVMGSTDRLDLLTLDTRNGVERVTVTGTTTQTALHVNIGDAQFDEDLAVTGGVSAASLTATAPAILLHEIRFCGNGPNGATTVYAGPVLVTDIINATGGEQDPVDISFGSTLCDGLDNTTEATADRVYHSATAFKPVSMVCTAICTGASAANDAVVFALRSGEAAVAGMTCTTAALGGDATPAQCTVTDTTPATIAAGATWAVSITATDDDCNDAGDDIECRVFATF